MNDERDIKTAMSGEQQNQSAPVDALARAVHWTLLIGLVCSAMMMVAGLVVAFWKNQPRPEALITNLRELLRMAGDGNGVAWMELGVLMLLATPIMRVVVLAIGWGARRDGRMALVAFVVLVLLAASILLSAG